MMHWNDQNLILVTFRSPALEGIKPLFTRKLPDLDLADGEDFTLTCRVMGDPPPLIIWWHNDDVIEEQSHHQRRRIRTIGGTSSLTITKASGKDRGVYTCAAANEFGKAPTTATVAVTGMSKV